MTVALALLFLVAQATGAADSAAGERLQLRVAVNCRIGAERLVVERRSEPEGLVLALNGAGRLSDAQLGCYGDALANADVSSAIEDSGLYRRYVAILERIVVREARRDLSDLGLLHRLPRRARRDSLAGHAARLERLCGVPRLSLLRVQDGLIRIVAPGDAPETSDERRKRRCAVAAVIVAGYGIPPVYSPENIPALF